MGQTFSLPYRQDIGRDFDGLRIQATPKVNARFFYVKFFGAKSDQDASFEFCASFKFSFEEKKTVCSIKKSNSFFKNNVKDIYSFPFKISTEFQMKFKRKNDRKLQVFVNGTEYFTYDIEMGISSFNAYEVGGDLENGY
ncbi:galectin-6-like [Biomphalaria glabrata]|uniref:Galectin n=1 Tax=Biomphalaria glabrata TaxID=6526 RepID=A0A9W3ABJ8_BIOGL|nr:galectin-6-like [Biomphalaria glabrata]